MTRDLESTWDRLRAFPGVVVGKGATEQEVASAESALGLRIQGPYREFLLRFGWARIIREEFFGLGQDVPPGLNVLEISLRERNKSQPRLRKEYIPVRHDGGGNFDCIYVGAIRGLENPMILWEREEGAQQTPEQTAADFSEWLWVRLNELEE
jgi:hypothetical protein